MNDHGLIVAAVFFGLSNVAGLLIGSALWPEPPLRVTLGGVAALVALSVAVYGFSRDE